MEITLNEALEKFMLIDKKLSSYELNDKYKIELEELLNTNLAVTKKGIVYIWQAEKPIPRLKGESRIFYIGQTKNTLKNRYWKYTETLSNGEPWRRHSHIMRKYGVITISICDFKLLGNTLEEAEDNLIKLYFNFYLEMPPLNYK